MYIEQNKPLAPFTTFGIGRPARWFVDARSEDDVAEACAWALDRGTPFFVLGGGSNLLVADTGFSGLVLHVGLEGIQTHERDGRVTYRAAAGEDWDRFVQQTVDDRCAGIECLAGIPGTVGGTPVQNVGAYGQEISRRVEQVRAYDTKEGRFVEFSASECCFGYRRSRFNTIDAGRYVVVRVDYVLTPGGLPTLQYTDLQKEFANLPGPSLAELATAVRRLRQSKGMLLVEGDPDCRSAGSFFKNPVVTNDRFGALTALSGKEPPYFPAGEDANTKCVKLSAAWLIEQAGFSKGFGMGNAGVSSRHTLALINRGGATAAEVLALAHEIARKVEACFGVRLEREPVLLGFS